MLFLVPFTRLVAPYLGLFVLLLFLLTNLAPAQAQPPIRDLVLRPARMFDGEQMHTGWTVVVRGERIVAAGPTAGITVPAGANVLDLPTETLLPGLIEGHGHLLLHPYDETAWDAQVLNESRAERTLRAANHARATLAAGFTTLRDLGTEGAEYDDVGIKQSIEKGIIAGPRLSVCTRALVATGSYGPKGFSPGVVVPQGAEEADGIDDLIKAVRRQIGQGADFIKVYADYRWGLRGDPRPTFTETELKLIVETARSSGRYVAAHAQTAEAMRRCVLAGVTTIEHGDNGTPEVFQLMKQNGVALCPTLAASDAVAQYRGWKKGTDPTPEHIQQKRESFRLALAAGVTICFGGDVGVFAHGDNAREMELMVDYGMPPLAVLRAATAVNAQVFGLPDQGRIRAGLLADLVVVTGDPSQQISDIRQIKLVFKGGQLVKN